MTNLLKTCALLTLAACVSCPVASAEEGPFGKVTMVYSDAKGIGQDKVMRRDPSDIIKVGDLYCVWYSKGPKSSGYNATVWYATSPDGPYIKHEFNPIIPGNHEVLVWPQGDGVAALIGKVGPAAWVQSHVYSEDGIHFTKTHDVE